MRRQNSEFNMAFMSHEGTQVFNHDYYGCIQLDKFACYVIADGIETGDDAKSAKLAVDAVALAFNSHPSMSKRALRNYLRQAHKCLRANKKQMSMKASITVVVTNYIKIRYAYVGNTRFNLFRGNFMIRTSRDHSLSAAMAKKGALPIDKVAQHEQRGNLSRYLGQDGRLNPQVSRKIKLQNGDIIALHTRGIWEHCDQYDLLAAFTEAGKDPKLALEYIERLILDMHPEELENYTLALIFIDKIFVDPNRGKKIKRLLMILIPILVILIILGVIVYFQVQKRKTNIQNMEMYFLNGIEYLQDDNYIKAKDELKQAYDLSLKVKDSARATEISNYQKFTEAVINADELLTQEDFDTALQAYLNARNRSKYTDNLGKDYIETKLNTASGYINVHDMLDLGDKLTDQGNYALAEQKYLEARNLASQIYYSDGKKEAIESLNSLYEQMDEEVADNKEESKVEIAATDFVTEGNTAFQSGDLVSAEMYYSMAKEKYDKLGEDTMSQSMNEKLELVRQKQAQNEEQRQKAEEYVAAGDALMPSESYADAKKQYIYARDIYASLNDTTGLESVNSKIDIVDGYIADKKAEEQRPKLSIGS